MLGTILFQRLFGQRGSVQIYLLHAIMGAKLSTGLLVSNASNLQLSHHRAEF